MSRSPPLFVDATGVDAVARLDLHALLDDLPAAGVGPAVAAFREVAEDLHRGPGAMSVSELILVYTEYRAVAPLLTAGTGAPEERPFEALGKRVDELVAKISAVFGGRQLHGDRVLAALVLLADRSEAADPALVLAALLLATVRPAPAAPAESPVRVTRSRVPPTLAPLLVGLFSPGELTALVRVHSPELVHAISGPETPHAARCDEVVAGLARRGEIDAGFFKALLALRPGRATDILRVRDEVFGAADAPVDA